MVNVHAKLSAYAYTSFVSDLVLAKLEAVGKHLGKLLLFARLLTGHIVRGHVGVIVKLSPHYVLTEFTISDVTADPIPPKIRSGPDQIC